VSRTRASNGSALSEIGHSCSHLPELWEISYNLACYTCQLGRLDEARQWFHRALTLGDEKAIKLEALDDPDLAPLLGTQTG
jgi:hypothetical protein